MIIINIFLLLLGIVLIIINIQSKADIDEKCLSKLKKINLQGLIIGIFIFCLSTINIIFNFQHAKTKTKFAF